MRGFISMHTETEKNTLEGEATYAASRFLHGKNFFHLKHLNLGYVCIMIFEKHLHITKNTHLIKL